jgi:triphosphatase
MNGLPSITPQTACRAAAHQALAQVAERAQAALAAEDPEHLHQLRVGMRRLRAALRAFRPILPRKKAKRVRDALRELSPTLGRARDWDVLLERLEAARAAPELIARVQSKRAKAWKKVLRALSSKEFARLLQTALEPRPTSQGLAEFGAAALERAHRKLMKEARAADWRNPAERHAVRIRVKRLRYSCEFFAPAFPGTEFISELKALQEILGALNDIAVGRRLAGFDADEAALLNRLELAWARFARRAPFWRVQRLRGAARRSRSRESAARALSGSRRSRKPEARAA